MIEKFWKIFKKIDDFFIDRGKISLRTRSEGPERPENELECSGRKMRGMVEKSALFVRFVPRSTF